MPTILCTIYSDLIEISLQRLPKLLLMPICSSQTTSGARLLHSSCTQAIITAVLAINDKHMLPIKHFQDIKLVVFAPILPGCIPLKHQISQLDFLLPDLLVKGLLDLLLMIMSSIHYLLSILLDLYQLMNSPDHIIRLPLTLLEEFCYR